EVWFDGANGEGPNGKHQVYDWPRVFGLVRRLQPEAVMFSDAGPDVRWCGNENGSAGNPNWSTVDPAVVPFPGATGPAIAPELQHGDPVGSVWRPSEADTSIRPGWFNHPAEDARVKAADALVELYFRSVGRNSKLLLNVPPTRDGLLNDVDVSHLTAFHERLSSLFASDLAAGAAPAWRPTGATTAELEIDLGRTVTVGMARLGEHIARGQTVSRYTLLGADTGDWSTLSTGSTIGYARLDRFVPVPVRRVKLVIDEAAAAPEPITVQLYGGAG
ncbi:MAG TPA: alpha-L-fucosidase, partial [Gemmatimonadaceae bacterium]|nr:alpha-L-fucosidase [Gemmatimonadaceae bacterium]